MLGMSEFGKGFVRKIAQNEIINDFFVLIVPYILTYMIIQNNLSTADYVKYHQILFLII